MTKAELEAPPMLLTTGDTGKLQEVQQLDLHDPFKTLGINKTISGDQQSQITKMKTTSDACARGILSVSAKHFKACMNSSRSRILAKAPDLVFRRKSRLRR